MTYRVNILDPKAKKLLLEMEAKKLISISKMDEKNFLNIVKRIRRKAIKFPIDKEEITREVEIVRAQRHSSNN